jgi:signal peptidase II
MPKIDSPPGRWRRDGFFFLAALLLLVADQLTKLWIRTNLVPGESLPEEGIFRLTYVTNTGGVFGLFVNQTTPLVFSTIIAIIAVLLFYKCLPRSYLLPRIGLGLLLGGSVGNLIDRVCLGEVTDFIDIRVWHNFRWPAFNLADTAIVIGVIIVACSFLFLIGSKVKHDGNPLSSS